MYKEMKLHAPTKVATISYSSETLFVDALEKMVEGQIKDKLQGFLENGKKKDYTRFKSYFTTR